MSNHVVKMLLKSGMLIILYSMLAAVPGDFTFTCPEPDPFQGPQISIPQAAEDEPEVLTLYPVPVSDRLKIETSGPMTSITVTNASGAAMVQESVASHNFTLDVSQWPQGIYLISIQTASGLSLTEKFTIAR